MFAPCAGDIGGIPRDEAFHSQPSQSKSPQQLVRKQSKQSAATPATVPFEVSASSSSLSLDKNSRAASPIPAAPFQKESLCKLRQLGAQHQLASGLHGESLADVARPCSPEKNETPDLIDFDDGISAISSHTLEEMEKRRIQSGAPIPKVAEAVKVKLNSPIKEDVEWKQTRTEFEPFNAEVNPFPIEISRIESISTRQTNATEESFQKFMQDEVKYWEGEVRNDRQSRKDRPSLEERARKLRELSRSRSRSDGTGSVSYICCCILYLSQSTSPVIILTHIVLFAKQSGKSKSSLLSGSHPHDTVPVFSSDLFGKTKPRSSRSTLSKISSRKNFVAGSFDNSDPFVALDYGEI